MNVVWHRRENTKPFLVAERTVKQSMGGEEEDKKGYEGVRDMELPLSCEGGEEGQGVPQSCRRDCGLQTALME